jgi:SAM-dependent methyltransferase
MTQHRRKPAGHKPHKPARARSSLLLRVAQYPGQRVVLHVGCGAHPSAVLAREFPKPDWVEVRLDIDPAVKPDIVASITDLRGIESGAIDAVFSSHNLEHLFAHEVPLALREFTRVLAPSGIALIGVPDLQRVAEWIAQDKLVETAYVSPAGPIAPIDMLYGHRGYVAQGLVFMAHKTGFTARSLAQALVDNGFARADVSRTDWDLWAVGQKSAPVAAPVPDTASHALAQ